MKSLSQFRSVPIPAVLLAIILQIAPLVRNFVTQWLPSTANLAIVFRWAAGAIAVSESVQAVSGATVSFDTFINSPTNALGTNGRPFSYAISVGGAHGADWFAVGPTAPGLTHASSATAILSGTPTATGTYNTRLEVRDAGRADRAFVSNVVIRIVDTNGPPQFILPPRHTTYTNNGATVTLSARAVGKPGISYSWHFTNGLIRTGTNNLILTNIQPHQTGSYFCVASNSLGLSTSEVAVVTLGSILVQRGSTWRYLDDGSSPAASWINPGFNDVTWSNGPAQLGYGDGDEQKVIRGTTAGGSRIITTYFRQAFVVTNAAQFTNLTFRLLRDDGAVVYLNGIELFRDNMPTFPLISSTVASRAVDTTNETTFFEYTLPKNGLITGTNVVAVEVHQVSTSSSDVSFDLQVVGGQLVTEPPARPGITSQPASQVATVGQPVTISVTATGTPPLTFQWRRNGNPFIGGSTSNLFFASVQLTNAGDYLVIVSNPGGSVTSSVASLTVNPAITPPQITGQPQPQRVYPGTPAQFTVVATGTEPLLYQWFRGDSQLPGSTNATLTINAVVEADAANYSVTVTNGGGGVPSQPAALTVEPLPRIIPGGIVAPGRLAWSFPALAGKSYTVESRTNLTVGAWIPYTNLPPVATDGTLTLESASDVDAQRFFRLKSP